jgi:hypothetical protein
MNWPRVAGHWQQLKDRSRQRWGAPSADDLEAAAVRAAREKQLAEWTAERHGIDPIHK